jgi:hypothetical protein
MAQTQVSIVNETNAWKTLSQFSLTSSAQASEPYRIYASVKAKPGASDKVYKYVDIRLYYCNQPTTKGVILWPSEYAWLIERKGESGEIKTGNRLFTVTKFGSRVELRMKLPERETRVVLSAPELQILDDWYPTLSRELDE